MRELSEEEEEEAEEGKEFSVIITPAVALWTFSLAANLERPVPPHAAAALSALGKAAGAEAKRIRRRRKKEEVEGAAAAAEDGDKASSTSHETPSFLAASSPCPHAAVVAAVCGAYFVQCEELSRAAKEGWP